MTYIVFIILALSLVNQNIHLVFITCGLLLNCFSSVFVLICNVKVLVRCFRNFRRSLRRLIFLFLLARVLKFLDFLLIAGDDGGLWLFHLKVSFVFLSSFMIFFNFINSFSSCFSINLPSFSIHFLFISLIIYTLLELDHFLAEETRLILLLMT